MVYDLVEFEKKIRIKLSALITPPSEDILGNHNVLENIVHLQTLENELRNILNDELTNDQKYNYLKFIFSKFPAQQLRDIITKQNAEGETIFYLLIKGGQLEILQNAVQLLEPNKLQQLLNPEASHVHQSETETCSVQQSVLSAAAQIQSEKVLLAMLEYLFSLKPNWDPAAKIKLMNDCFRRLIGRVLITGGSLTFQECLKFILSQGAEVDARSDVFKATALHHAVQAGNIELVQFLLAAKADPNSLDEDNLTPLDYTLPEIIAQSFVKISNTEQIHLTYKDTHSTIATLLLKAGANEVNKPHMLPCPSIEPSLISNLEHEEKLRNDEAPTLSDEIRKQLAQDEKLIEEIYQGLNFQVFNCKNEEEIKAIKEKYPGYYYFIEPRQESKDVQEPTVRININQETKTIQEGYSRVTIYQKISAEQQKRLDAIQVRTKPIILKNRLGFDLLHFNMSRHLQHVDEKTMNERTYFYLKKLHEQLKLITIDPKSHERKSEITELKIDMLVLKGRLESNRKFVEHTSKFKGLSHFDRYIQTKSKNKKFIQQIGKYTLEFIDLRGENDYLWFLNTILSRPDRLIELLKGEPSFFDFAGSISVCLNDLNTRVFAGGHQMNLLFPLQLVLSIPVELIGYIGPTDIDSPYNCPAIEKIQFLHKVLLIRAKMDHRQAFYQLHSLSSNPARTIPDCPFAIRPALNKDPQFLMPRPKQHGSLPLYTPEGIIRDTHLDSKKRNSYNEGIIKTNPFLDNVLKDCGQHSRIKGKLLLVEKYFLDKFLKDRYQAKELSELQLTKIEPTAQIAQTAQIEETKKFNEIEQIDQSLEILDNIKQRTQGRLELALIETNTEGFIRKLPAFEQANKLNSKLKEVWRECFKLQLSKARYKLKEEHLCPVDLKIKLEEAQREYHSLIEIFKEFKASIHASPRVKFGKK